MMKVALFYFFIIALITLHRCTSSEGSNNSTTPSDSGVEAIASNLDVPWAMDFLPDDRIIFTERPGSVKIITNGKVQEIGKINVAAHTEAGLLGLAVDPDFNNNHYIYLYYSYQGSKGLTNRISRFTLNSALINESILIDTIPGSTNHDGGGLTFGPDGMLYAGTGDARDPSRSQDTFNPGGKILRMHKDGTVPAGNPFNNLVYALGIRNCEGLTWLDRTLYATEHGPVQYDEINIINKRQNYGWPLTCDKVSAFRCYSTFTLAPAGIAASDKFLFVTGLRGTQLRRIDIQSGNEQPLFTHYGRLRIVKTHKNFLYFGTSNRDGRGRPTVNDDRIFRVPLGLMTR